MLSILFNLKFILPALLLLNVAGVYLFRKEFRFVKGSVFLFILLFSGFIVYRFLVSPTQTKQIQASRQTEIKRKGWDYLNNPDLDADFQKKEILTAQVNFALFRITGLQAAFAFIFACIGLFITADKKLYAGFALGFFVLAYIFLN